MNVLLAVDPGIRGCGAALYEGGKLVKAAYLVNPAKSGGGPGAAASMALEVLHWAYDSGYDVSELALEWPRIYASRIRAGASPGDPNDLLGLAGVDAAVAAFFVPCPVAHYAPSDWKGNLPKPKTTKQVYAVEVRVRKRLEADELAALDSVQVARSLFHNVVDAVGIGLHDLGRFECRRVIPS